MLLIEHEAVVIIFIITFTQTERLGGMMIGLYTDDVCTSIGIIQLAAGFTVNILGAVVSTTRPGGCSTVRCRRRNCY